MGRAPPQQDVPPAVTDECHDAAALLRLLGRQLHAAMDDNDRAMAELISRHGDIALDIARLRETCAGQADLAQLGARLEQATREMAVQFQQHDSFNQRLEHLAAALDAARMLLGRPGKREDPASWAQLAEQIHACYTTTAERDTHRGKRRAAKASGDVELF